MNTLKLQVNSIMDDHDEKVVTFVGDSGTMIIRNPNLSYEVGQVVTVTVEQYG